MTGGRERDRREKGGRRVRGRNETGLFQAPLRNPPSLAAICPLTNGPDVCVGAHAARFIDFFGETLKKCRPDDADVGHRRKGAKRKKKKKKSDEPRDQHNGARVRVLQR